MRRSLLFLTCALVLTITASHCTAGLISFTLGATPNLPPTDANLIIDGGGFQGTLVTGTATLDLPDHSTSSGTAQIVALDLTLTNGLSFDLPSLGAGVTATTAPGDVSFSLVTPGAAAPITPAIGGGNFDQLGNQLVADGDLTISNSSTVDLSTLSISLTDFTFSGVGEGAPLGFGPNDLILAAVFVIDEELEVDGTTIPLIAGVQFSGIGTKPVKTVPEPGSAMILIGMGTVLLTRRRR